MSKPLSELKDNCKDELKALLKILGSDAARTAARETFDALIQAVYEVMDCDHVFLSLYDSERQLFVPAAWRSTLKPSDIPREQKFMWDKYQKKEAVIINDLACYNHRLHRTAARLCMQSVIGVPVGGGKELAGVLEVYSHKAQAFSDVDVDLLTIYARRIEDTLQRFEQSHEIKYLTAENLLLRLLITSEKLPVTELLFNLGDLFKTALSVDGIAVLSVEADADRLALKEVMSDNFSDTAIQRLISSLTSESLRKLADLPDGVQERYLIKHSSTSIGMAEAKSVYIIPIAWRKQLQGLIVFYRRAVTGDRNPVKMLHFIRQITEHIGTVFDRKNTYAHMQKISLTDALTGLANRRLFDYALEREFSKARQGGKPLSLLLIDIDHFKKVNDEHGHITGDIVLEEMGKILAGTFRATDIVARYGGEEFAVIIPEAGRNEAMMRAEHLREYIASREFMIGNHPFKITVSIGSVTYEAGTDSELPNAEMLLWAADQALYQAKQLGRNLTIVWSKM